MRCVLFPAAAIIEGVASRTAPAVRRQLARVLLSPRPSNRPFEEGSQGRKGAGGAGQADAAAPAAAARSAAVRQPVPDSSYATCQ
jgi:hypothetical protein